MTKKECIIAKEVDMRKISLVFHQRFGFISVKKIAEITGIDSRRVFALLKENMGFMFKPWYFVLGQF